MPTRVPPDPPHTPADPPADPPRNDSFLAALASDGRLLVDLVASAPGTAVPACEPWTAEKLGRHVAGLWAWVAACVEQAPEPVDPASLPVPPKGEALEPFATGALDSVLEVLDGADPEGLVHTWAGPRPAAWWMRRLAHETSVHRVDAEQAVRGTDSGVVAEMAVDGIDEVLATYAPLAYQPGVPATVHLHATDADGEWLIELGDELAVRHEHAKGDVAARGPAGDLFLVLWHRRPTDGLEVFGEVAVLDRLLACTRF